MLTRGEFQMINILKQELIKMKELQEFCIASSPRVRVIHTKIVPKGRKIEFERRKFELTDVRVN